MGMLTIVGAFGRSSSLVEDIRLMATSLAGDDADNTRLFSVSEIGCHVACVGSYSRSLDESLSEASGRRIGLVTSREDEPELSGSADDCLIALYRKHGNGFLDHVNEQIACFLLDLDRGLALICNDRFGLERIYYRIAKDAFFFSSSAACLLSFFKDSRRIDPTAAAETYRCGCVMGGRTLFPEIKVLPPASCVTFSKDKALRVDDYFQPSSWEQRQAMSNTDFHGALRDTLASVIPRYSQGTQKIGMSLTGGLDGRIVMAWSGARPGELPCYTFGSAIRDSRDVKIARRVAMECCQPHRTLVVDREFMTRFPELASRTVQISDGTMDVSGSVELYVNELARELAPIRLTGNYGSEITRGNVAFRPREMNAEFFEPEFERLLNRAGDVYDEERKGNDLSFVAFKQVPWHHFARFSIERSQLAIRSPFLDAELVSLMYQLPKASIDMVGVLLSLVHDKNAKLASLKTDAGHRYGQPKPIYYMRHAVGQFSSKAEYAYDYGMPQWLARIDNLVRGLRPERLFLGRHKFYHFRTWYRRELAEYVQDTLMNSSAEERSYFRPGVLKRLVRDHVSGRGNHTLEIHKALTFELIYQTLLEI